MAQADIITNAEVSALVRKLNNSKVMDQDVETLSKITRQYNEAGYVTSVQLNQLKEIDNNVLFLSING